MASAFDRAAFQADAFQIDPPGTLTLSTTGYTPGDQVFCLGVEILAQASPLSIQAGPFTDYFNGGTSTALNISCSSAAFFIVGLLAYNANTGQPAQATTSVSGGRPWFKLAGSPANNGQFALEYWGAYAALNKLEAEVDCLCCDAEIRADAALRVGPAGSRSGRR